MREKRPYSYTVLRYVHDVLTGEFVNVGVVVYIPSEGWLRVKARSSMGRVKDIFPDLNMRAFTAAMTAIRRGVDKIAKHHGSDNLLSISADAVTLARDALPPDDSSLQWSPKGTGLTNDPEATLDRLYERFVARYDTQSAHRRTNDEIWRPVQRKLQEKHLASILQEKTISGAVDDIVFRHAWKNGLWHVYEPVSFDLADGDGIKTKAREWLGHLSAVVAGGSAEPFKPYFVIGAPSDPELQSAYRSALSILERAPNDPTIYEESQIDGLVAEIESEMQVHETKS